MAEKNFKQLVMSALCLERNSDIPAEVVGWVDSHLPNENGLGANTNPSRDVEHLFDDFKGFTSFEKMNMPEGFAIGEANGELTAMMNKMQARVKKLGGHILNEIQLLSLTKDLNKEELAVIVLTGLGAFKAQMKEAEKEAIYRKHKGGFGMP